MSKNIAIIGAGISGLTAAIELESLGYTPVIFEADKKVGGRVQSDVYEGYIMDHGFQVLLSAYPMAQKYLNFETLALDSFESGSYIFKNGKQFCIGDPLRDSSLVLPTLFSTIGSFSDKLKIFKLSRSLKSKTIDEIFNAEEKSTYDYLKDFGFSTPFIKDFFQPFFGGIFLENELQTSSRMFEFIFKMFNEGNAVIPRKGIQEIPNQLQAQLKETKIYFSAKVEKIVGNTIHFSDGATHTSDYIIVATEASKIVPQLAASELTWKGTETLYFEVEKNTFERHMIGLIAFDENCIINSICFPKSVLPEAQHKLLSVSITKTHQFSDANLIIEVEKDLKTVANCKPLRFLKKYTIPLALPDLTDVKRTVHPSETQLTTHIFLAGDTLLNGSLNAAMHSGELAAQAIHEKISGNMFS
ncbi:protoporphyrinogen/coproporphyrinogen oxidase [Aquimarina agarivorans]|uniref:protoporphyrinogen/coproporphyrinogen oxidase n=1 Tax=Aquimarina agarivorans TaxID=980584 RepID=UPI000248E890|nr:NAD(P)/FAD-dependent oxidoreductase [Aquimarina agarivorans]